MSVTVRKSFEEDILKISNPRLAEQINSVIIEKLENSVLINHVQNPRKMKENYYRTGVRETDLDCVMINLITVVLLRFMHRKEIYKHFPL